LTASGWDSTKAIPLRRGHLPRKKQRSRLLNAAIRRRPLKSTAFLPFGLFLAPAIWLGWLTEALLN